MQYSSLENGHGEMQCGRLGGGVSERYSFRYVTFTCVCDSFKIPMFISSLWNGHRMLTAPPALYYGEVEPALKTSTNTIGIRTLYPQTCAGT